MSGDLWPVPSSVSELKTLPVYVKPDWHGFLAHVVGAVFWLGELLRIKAATRAMDEYAQTIDGAIYNPRGGTVEISRGLELHESGHDWQEERIGRWRYRVYYLFSKKFRRHSECQNYGIEVAIGAMTLFSAAEEACKMIYRLGLNHADCSVLIADYSSKYTRECEGIEEERRLLR